MQRFLFLALLVTSVASPARPDRGTASAPAPVAAAAHREVQGKKPIGKFKLPPALAGLYPSAWGGPETLSMENTSDRELIANCLIAGAILNVLFTLGAIAAYFWLRRVRLYVKRQARLAAGPALLS